MCALIRLSAWYDFQHAPTYASSKVSKRVAVYQAFASCVLRAAQSLLLIRERRLLSVVDGNPECWQEIEVYSAAYLRRYKLRRPAFSSFFTHAHQAAHRIQQFEAHINGAFGHRGRARLSAAF